MRGEAVEHLRAVVVRALGHDVVDKPLRRGQPLECDAAFFRTGPGDADRLDKDFQDRPGSPQSVARSRPPARILPGGGLKIPVKVGMGTGELEHAVPS